MGRVLKLHYPDTGFRSIHAWPICGSRNRDLAKSTKKVTCKNCLRVLEAERRKKEAASARRERRGKKQKV